MSLSTLCVSDITDITRFLYCPTADGQAAQYQCPDDYVYNSKRYACEKVNSPVDCSQHSNEFVSLEVNSAYYAYCPIIGSTSDSKIFKCHNEVDFYFDIESSRCIFRCTTIGIFADRMNCHQYYICDPDDSEEGKYLAILQKCPFKHYYKNNECVREYAPCISQWQVDMPAAPSE